MTTIGNDVWRSKAPFGLGEGAVFEILRRPFSNGALGVRRVLRAAVREWRVRQSARTLQALDDRMLRDIGIARSEIAYRVRLHRTAQW